MKLKISSTRALRYLEGRQFEDNPLSVAMAMAETLRHLGLPVNGEQLLVWTGYDDRRKHRFDPVNRVRPLLGRSAIVARLTAYNKNWYRTHVRWLNDPNTAPKYDPLADAVPSD